MYFPKEFGSENGGILVTSTIDSGVYTATEGHVIYSVVPDPSVTVKAVPKDTSKAYFSSDRTADGVAKETSVGFSGRYSSVTVTAGQCIVYEVSESPTI